jgi:hypothetical protein
LGLNCFSSFFLYLTILWNPRGSEVPKNATADLQSKKGSICATDFPGFLRNVSAKNKRQAFALWTSAQSW